VREGGRGGSRHTNPHLLPAPMHVVVVVVLSVSLLMREFIRRMRSSGTAWQVCYASHSLFN